VTNTGSRAEQRRPSIGKRFHLRNVPCSLSFRSNVQAIFRKAGLYAKLRPAGAVTSIHVCHDSVERGVLVEWCGFRLSHREGVPARMVFAAIDRVARWAKSLD
jgi:hypothetical protein